MIHSLRHWHERMWSECNELPILFVLEIIKEKQISIAGLWKVQHFFVWVNFHDKLSKRMSKKSKRSTIRQMSLYALLSSTKTRWVESAARQDRTEWHSSQLKAITFPIKIKHQHFTKNSNQANFIPPRTTKLQNWHYKFRSVDVFLFKISFDR
jgi:hypothetical protein